MTTLIILSHQPYDNTDATYNALRLAAALKEQGQMVTLFLMNDAVDLAREICVPPAGYDQDLKAMLKAIIKSGVPVEVCGTCMTRCGIYANHPYFDGANKSTMAKLAQRVIEANKVLTF